MEEFVQAIIHAIEESGIAEHLAHAGHFLLHKFVEENLPTIWGAIRDNASDILSNVWDWLTS